MGTEVQYDPHSLDWSGDFESQVQNVMANVRLTRAEVENLSRLFHDLQTTLKGAWPGCQVMPFGSIVTGLGIISSDADVFVHINQKQEPNQAKVVILARNLLRKRHWLFQNPFAITTAKVPIVKFYHIPTSRHCDLSFKSPSGVRNSKIIAYLLRMDERALLLAILIKYWSKVHKLTGTNLLPNYSLTIMTVFYMQHKNILPPISLLQQLSNSTFFVDKWDTAFGDDYFHQTDNTESLYELLGGFFQFYSTYKYEEFIISPYVGNSIHKQLYENIEGVPNDFYLYKQIVNKDEVKPLKMNTPLCIQDIFEHNKNCAVGVHPGLALSLKLYFQLAAQIYSESSSQHFLKQILIKKPDLPKPTKMIRPNMRGKAKKRAKHQLLSKDFKIPGNVLGSIYIIARKKSKEAEKALREML